MTLRSKASLACLNGAELFVLNCPQPSIFDASKKHFTVQRKLYSNHLNTKHLKSEHLTFQTLFCPVFNWFDHLIRQTIWIPDILDYKTDIFGPVSRPPFEIWAIWQPDTFWTIWMPDLFGIQMVTLHLNSQKIEHSEDLHYSPSISGTVWVMV